MNKREENKPSQLSFTDISDARRLKEQNRTNSRRNPQNEISGQPEPCQERHQGTATLPW